MLRFQKAIYLSLLFKIILSERLNDSLCESEVLLYFELIKDFSIIPLLNLLYSYILF